MRSSPSTGLGSGSLRSVACCLSTAAGSPLGTFYAWVKRPLSARALWDIVITEILAGYYEPDDQGRKRPESLYGSVKMWAHLNREGIIVAKCTVERLMRTHGGGGATPQEDPHHRLRSSC